MTRKRRGICIHCLGERQVTMDHVLPKSWYPVEKPEDVQRWTAPAFLQCNQMLGKAERELKVRLGFCLSPENESAKGMYQASLRAIDPSRGRDGKDRKARNKLKDRIYAEIVPGSAELLESCLRGFGPADGYPVEDLIAVPIPKRLVELICEKMIRGLYFVLANGAYIQGDRYEVLSFQTGSNLTEDIDGVLDRAASRFEREIPPVLTVTGVFVPEAPMNGLMRVTIWNQWTWYSSVTDREDSL